jgi:hypothetical protein
VELKKELKEKVGELARVTTQPTASSDLRNG